MFGKLDEAMIQNDRDRQVAPFPTKLVGVAAVLTLAVLAWLSWFAYDTYKFVQDTNTRIIGLERARGDIIHLDEVLTMSASMAAATGEVEWIDRYWSFEPKLDAAIKQAIDIAQQPDIADAIRETDVANVELVKMENQAFALVRVRKLEEARAILSGASYSVQKQLYAGGMKKLLQGLRAEREATVESQRTATLGSILVMGAVAAVIIVAWLIVLGRVREWRAAMSKNVSDLVRAEDALRKSHDNLERRVKDRTQELEDEIAERNRADEALKESHERQRLIFESSPYGVSVVSANDPNKRLYVNSRFVQMFGAQSAEQLLERSAADSYVDPKDREKLSEIASNGSYVTDAEIERLRLDGSRWWCHLHRRPIWFEGEDVIVVWHADVTDRKQAEEDRRKALAEAEQATRAKSEFLAAMSHDLRTPLNAILGFADILSGQYFGPISEKYQEYATDIHSSGEHLLELLNEILDLSTIEAGKQSVVKEKLSALEIVRECMRIVEDKARSNGIDLVTEIPKDLPPLYADKRATKQILLNLLSNAVKFTPQGGKITVSAKASKRNTTLKVADTGKGIPAEKLPKLTDPFTKAGLDPYLAEEGWGLGLTITKALVDLHDGKLDIKSKVGKGTTVTVTLPNGAS